MLHNYTDQRITLSVIRGWWCVKKEGEWFSMILQSAITHISNFYGSHNHCG